MLKQLKERFEQIVNVSKNIPQENLTSKDMANIFEKLAKQIEEDLKNNIYICWGVEDVIFRAKEKGISLSNEQAKEVLKLAEKYHDNNNGINWRVLDYYIEIINN